ncbi:DMT family transporter [Bosea sp. NBC_00550]|uniref:DMT family transporter n=1 Tax=Bosea sp. NBC_00550 TaxID=2969621 RepID=UPI0022321683|nr:DMT family transporter [Bosea sp. NBC_00550]UZF93332.1 DMT family transporter [Bosea sp. NBC_00550]
MDQRIASLPAPHDRERRRRRLAVAGMLLSVVIFGSNFVISRHAVLHGITPYDLLALRFATAGILLLPLYLRPGIASCGGVGWGRGLLLALSSGFPMTFLMLMGLTLAPAAHGATIGPGTVTLIGIVGSVVLFGAVLTRNLIVGICGVLAGLACLAIAGTTGASAGTLRGDLMFLGVGLLWGFYPLMIQLWKVDGLRAAAVVSVLSLAWLPVYALFFFRGFDIAPWWVLSLHALYQGVINVIIGLWIWGWAAHVLGPAVVGRFPPLIPVTGTLLAIPVLGEIPSSLQLIGIVLIISGLFVASWRKPPRKAGHEHVPADRDGQA